MKGKSCWQDTPYRPADKRGEAQNPWICRLAPAEDSIEFEWIDNGAPDAPHVVQFRPVYADAPWTTQPLTARTARIDHLDCWREYELRICREDGTMGVKRLARTGPVPGTVINYLHPQDDVFSCSGYSLCSPSMVRTPGGALLASMDVYGSDTAQNLTFLYRSEDDGETWRYVCDLHPLFWGNLFVHRDRLYILGVSTEFGDMVIGASDDDGFTWTAPVHLFCGSSTVGSGWQQAAMPVLRRNGRLHFSVEYGRLPDVSISILSVSENADLLDPASWFATEPLPFNRKWPDSPDGDPRMYVEGNLLTDKNGKMIDLVRVNLHGCSPDHGKMCVLRVDNDHPEAPCTFDQWIDMPSGSNSKTHILFDDVSGRYIAIGNLMDSASRQRNILALMSSEDAYFWQADHILIGYRNAPKEWVGFQYPSFLIEGDDILLQLRTAFNGARSYHDANYSTFHRIRNFRQYLWKSRE